MKNRLLARIGLAGALATAVLLSQSGCTCHRVRQAGLRRVTPEPVAAWTNAAGDVALECELRRWQDRRPDGDLGRRFLCGTRKEIAERWARQQREEPGTALCLRPYRWSDGPPERLFGNEMTWFPASIRRPLSRTFPGREADWDLYRKYGRDEHFPPIPVEHDGKISGWNLVLGCHATREFREWWGYPAQILLVPAFAWDCVTFPFQLLAAPYAAMGHI